MGLCILQVVAHELAHVLITLMESCFLNVIDTLGAMGISIPVLSVVDVVGKNKSLSLRMMAPCSEHCQQVP